MRNRRSLARLHFNIPTADIPVCLRDDEEQLLESYPPRTAPRNKADFATNRRNLARPESLRDRKLLR